MKTANIQREREKNWFLVEFGDRRYVREDRPNLPHFNQFEMRLYLENRCGKGEYSFLGTKSRLVN